MLIYDTFNSIHNEVCTVGFSSLNISHTEEVVRLKHSDAALQIYLSKIFQKQPFPSVGDVIAIYCQEYGRSKSVNIHY